MTIRKPVSNSAGIVAFMLGNLAFWWGVGVAPAFAVGYALIQPRTEVVRRAAAGLRMPVELPLIGVALAAAGLWLGRYDRKVAAGTCGVALAINLVGLAFAVLALMMQ